ncbi:MAG: hypothetical protein ACKPBT_15780, partial [Microcystis aeruginosa]
IPYNPVHCITQTEESGVLSEQHMDDNIFQLSVISYQLSVVTWDGSIGWHKSTKSLSGKRFN